MLCRLEAIAPRVGAILPLRWALWLERNISVIKFPCLLTRVKKNALSSAFLILSASKLWFHANYFFVLSLAPAGRSRVARATDIAMPAKVLAAIEGAQDFSESLRRQRSLSQTQSDRGYIGWLRPRSKGLSVLIFAATA